MVARSALCRATVAPSLTSLLMTAPQRDVRPRNYTPCHLLLFLVVSIPATAAQLRSTYIPTPKGIRRLHANDSCHHAIALLSSLIDKSHSACQSYNVSHRLGQRCLVVHARDGLVRAVTVYPRPGQGLPLPFQSSPVLLRCLVTVATPSGPPLQGMARSLAFRRHKVTGQVPHWDNADESFSLYKAIAFLDDTGPVTSVFRVCFASR